MLRKWQNALRDARANFSSPLGKEPAPFSGLQMVLSNERGFAFFKGPFLSETLCHLLLLPSTLQRKLGSSFNESQLDLQQLEKCELCLTLGALLPSPDLTLTQGWYNSFFLHLVKGLPLCGTGWCPPL